MVKALPLLVASLCALIGTRAISAGDSEIVFDWGVLDYDWDVIGISKEEALARGQDHSQAINQSTGAFIPEYNCMAGLKAFSCGDECTDYFVTVPRWMPGVPSTLNKVVNKDGANVLQPYPQGINPPLRYVQSMEIDTKGRMWIIDVGRLNIASPNSSDVVNGPASLIIWDISANQEILRFEFPDDVAPYDGNFLNDLVVDVDRNVAYISDAGVGSLIVFDATTLKSARFSDDSTLRDASYDWIIEGVEYGNSTLSGQADGIALTPDMKYLYWCPCQGVNLYRTKTAELRQLLNGDLSLVNVELVAEKSTPADGMTFSREGVLYSGGNADPDLDVWSWDASKPFTTAPLAPVIWADTFAFDGVGNILWTRNNLAAFFAGTMDFTKESGNFQVVQFFINSTSYMG